MYKAFELKNKYLPILIFDKQILLSLVNQRSGAAQKLLDSGFKPKQWTQF
jgi:hypothetical protein